MRGVYFRFVKEAAKNKKWKTFLNNVSGKGSGGGVIYFIPYQNTANLEFTHIKDQDGGKNIGGSNSIDQVKTALGNVSKALDKKTNQTEIAFTDKVGMYKISDFFVSKNSYQKCKEECRLNKYLKIDILLENYKKNEDLDGVYNSVVSAVTSMLKKRKYDDNEIAEIKAFVFNEDTFKLKDLNSIKNNYVYRGKVKKSDNDLYYWFKSNDGVGLEDMSCGEDYIKPKSDATNARDESKLFDVRSVIIVSWLKQVESLLYSICNDRDNGLKTAKEKWNIDGYKENMDKIEEIREDFFENEGDSGDGIFKLTSIESILRSKGMLGGSKLTKSYYKPSTSKQTQKM